MVGASMFCIRHDPRGSGREMARVKVQAINGEHRLTGIELADAEEIFGENYVIEQYGTVRVLARMTTATVQAKLRNFGHSTTLSK